MKTADASGEINLRDGQIVHAQAGKLQGEEAVYEMAIWSDGDFIFQPGKDTEITSVRKSNTNLLMEAARRIDEWKVMSKRIPSTRMVPVFTSEATKTSVSLSPQEWMLISKTDERRTIEEIAIAVGLSPFEACKLLYGLITSGLISLKENFSGLSSEVLERLSADNLLVRARQIQDAARQLLKEQANQEELDKIDRLFKAEMESGRKADALLDLLRSLEKQVSAALGPNQVQTFQTRVATILQGQ